MSRIAVLIIDVQNGLFVNREFPIYREKEYLANINRIIGKAREADIPIIYIQHTDDDYLKRGSDNWQIKDEIKPAGDIIITKSHPDAFQDTALYDKLDQLGVEQLIIMGMHTEYCIDTTCRRAYSLGFKTILIKDAHSTNDSPHLKAEQIIDHHNQVLGGWFVELKGAEEISFELL